MVPAAEAAVESTRLMKCPTGIQGLDEIIYGGLPRGRPTLVCGAAGSGKTLLAMEFLVRGATQYNEPGVFISFEESTQELVQNVASLGFDLPALEKNGKLALDFVFIERSQIEETGEFDLEGLLIRLKYAVDSVGAKRVVLDTVEALFAGLPNEMLLRAELRRLFRYLKQIGVTAVITGERGEATLTRHGIEEYVSDAVILLEQRLQDQIATRLLRIVKYRGSRHSADEYPFLITDQGLSILPVTSLGLDYSVSNERIPSGVARLDAMLGGQGYFRGSTILVSGTAGTGKSSLACCFSDAACRRGERVLYLALEESQAQITRNMLAIGLDLAEWVQMGLLRFHTTRPTLYGLEMHLATIHNLINEFHPAAVVMDPITNLSTIAGYREVKAMLMRLVDFFKNNLITALFTNLTHAGGTEITEVGVSSLMDTWILLSSLEANGERNRSLFILKSRGMAHSNQVREFLISSQGLELVDVYTGPGGVLTGSARVQQEARERLQQATAAREALRRQQALERRRQSLTAQIAALEAELGGTEADLSALQSQEDGRQEAETKGRRQLEALRRADAALADEKRQP